MNVIVESSHNHYTDENVAIYKTEGRDAVVVQSQTDEDVAVKHLEHENIPLRHNLNFVSRVMEADPMNAEKMREVMD